MRKPCYFQGCPERGTTREHIPAKSFFPIDQRNQLMTVRSCKQHNNEKSSDDMYVLAHICLNTSPRNRSREIFLERVVPQLGYNDDALKKMLSKDAEALPVGAVRYRVDTRRFDRFFSALSYGIVYKACGTPLPAGYMTAHIYHNFLEAAASPDQRGIEEMLLNFYSGEPMRILDFGRVNTMNETVYSAKVFGVPGFKGSITVRHRFYGFFQVTSMLTISPELAGISSEPDGDTEVDQHGS